MTKKKSRDSSPHDIEQEFIRNMNRACETRKKTSDEFERKLAELQLKFKSLAD